MAVLIDLGKIILGVGGAMVGLLLVVRVLLRLSDLGLLRSDIPLTFSAPFSDDARQEATARVERVAEQAGLQVQRFTYAQGGTSHGELAVALTPDATLTLEFNGEVNALVRATLTGFPPGLSLAADGERPTDRTGDPEFDARFTLRSSLWLSHGVLGADARQQLLLLLGELRRGSSLRVSAGTLTLTPSDAAAGYLAQRRLGELAALLRRVHSATRRSLPGERRVMDLARTDPSPGVRARAIDLLTEAPVAGEVRALVEAALGDPSPEVKLAAALALANISILNDSLEADLRRAVSRDPLRVLKGLEAAGAENALALLLAQEDEDVQVGAAEALGRIGTVGAVEPLRALTERGLLDSASKRAARQAILNIQSRLQGAEAGQVAVIEEAPQAGAVALADERGQLSVAERQGAHAAQRS